VNDILLSTNWPMGNTTPTALGKREQPALYRRSDWRG
jgi:hypothetical protein